MLIELVASTALIQETPQQVPAQLVPDLLGTAGLTNSVRRDRGQVVGCETTFRVLIGDDIYANGGLVTIDGSINFMQFDSETFAGTIKISGNDVFISQDQPITVPYESDYGYFLNANTDAPYSVLDAFQCENGGYCAAVDFETMLAMLAQLDFEGQIEGALNRLGGSTDLRFVIETEGTEWSFDDFSSCALRVLGNAR